MIKNKLLCVVPDMYGTGYFRMLRPHQHLQYKYGVDFNVTIVYQKDFKYKIEDLFDFNIIVYSKTILINNLMTSDNLLKLKSSGVKLVMDLDDYWEVNKNHPSYLNFKLHKYKDLVFENLKYADYVTCTTEHFANEIRKYHKNVIVFPNAIDFNENQWVVNEKIQSNRIRVMWCGGSSHLNDIQDLDYLVNKIKHTDLKNKIQIILCGFNLTDVSIDNSTWVKYEKILTDNYTTISKNYKDFLLKYDLNIKYDDLENEPYVRIPSTSINNYAKFYNLADICLAPLEKNKLNDMKSPLKLIEAGVYSKPIICGDTYAYKNDIINVYEKGGIYNCNTGNGFIVKDKKDYYKFIKYLVDNKDKMSLIGDNLHKKIKNDFDLEKITDKRYEFYLNICDSVIKY